MQTLYVRLCRDTEPLRNREAGRNELSEPNGLSPREIDIVTLRQWKDKGTDHNSA